MTAESNHVYDESPQPYKSEILKRDLRPEDAVADSPPRFVDFDSFLSPNFRSESEYYRHRARGAVDGFDRELNNDKYLDLLLIKHGMRPSFLDQGVGSTYTGDMLERHSSKVIVPRACVPVALFCASPSLYKVFAT